MTSKFWKYLITNHNGSALRFVTQTDRKWAEKELEGEPQLLIYRPKPQFQSSVLSRPAERVFRQLQRARAQLQKRRRTLCTIRL